MANITNFNPVVASAIQNQTLDLKFLPAMNGKLAYSPFTYSYKLDANLGESKTFTRNSRLPVDTTPSAPDDGTANLDNNMTANKAGVEQFTIQLLQWNRMDKVNLMQQEALIASDFNRSLGNLGYLAAQLKDRLVRKAYMDAYMGGNTAVIAGGTTSTTAAHVDDIRGFLNVLNTSGQLVAVNGSNTLLVDEINSSGAIVQTLTVTGASPDGSNTSGLFVNDNSLGGISGQLTFNTATSAPTVGNALVARNAPKVFRAGARNHYSNLTGGDIATVDDLDSIVTYLRNQGNPGFKDGYIYAIGGPDAFRHWRRDPQFQLAYQGRYDAPEVKSGRITEYGGVRFIETTEVPINTLASGSRVNRVLFTADPETCMEADWQGFNNYIAGTSSPTVYCEKMSSNCALFIPEPIDAMREQQKMAFKLVTGFSCGSDLKANDQNQIPTAAIGVMFRKAAIYEFVA
ncbi:MAG TPA: hypothetical protein V6C76_11710 [Drouetiella sp.]